MEELAQLGEERAVDVGDVLISAGDDASLTDRSLPSTATSRPTFSARAPLPYAGGDVRSGSSKRVVTAVGEGSAAVRSVHEYLATI